MRGAKLPLEGVTVVSLEQAVAAPFATRQLADLGARVIKVERPGVGDFARGYDETVRGMSSHFVWLNRSKESLALDLRQGEAREILRRLVARSDVFVQNLAPGSAGRLGFGADELRGEHPHLVYCSISGYGEGGPYTQKKAYDLLVQCEAGLVSITGTPETPSKVGVSIADIACGMYAYSGILAALLRRGRTGEGAVLEVSLFEALAEWMGFPAYYAMYGGKEPPRTGASHAAIARMRTVRGLLEHPQLEARDRWREVGSPVGPLRALLPPTTIDSIEPLMAPIPSVSEHTEKILAELGYDDDAVATLRQAAPICVVIEIVLPQMPYRVKFL